MILFFRFWNVLYGRTIRKKYFYAQGEDGGRYILFASQRVPHGAEEEIYIRKNKLVWSCAQTVIKSLTLPSEIVQVGWCCFLAEPQKDSRPAQHAWVSRIASPQLQAREIPRWHDNIKSQSMVRRELRKLCQPAITVRPHGERIGHLRPRWQHVHCTSAFHIRWYVFQRTHLLRCAPSARISKH